MRNSTSGVFWGVLLAFLVITAIDLAVKAAHRQEQEEQGVESVCGKMQATGAQSMADCKKQMKKMGY